MNMACIIDRDVDSEIRYGGMLIDYRIYIHDVTANGSADWTKGMPCLGGFGALHARAEAVMRHCLSTWTTIPPHQLDHIAEPLVPKMTLEQVWRSTIALPDLPPNSLYFPLLTWNFGRSPKSTIKHLSSLFPAVSNKLTTPLSILITVLLPA